MLKKIFKQLQLSEREYEVFRSLYKIGPNPASVIAKTCKFERTTVYRILQKLNKLGIISASKRQGIQIFFAENENELLKYIQQKRKSLEQIEENYDTIASELKSLKSTAVEIPKIKIYDTPNNTNQQSQLFTDIINETKIQKIRTIRLLASNTMNEQLSGISLKDTAQNFLHEIQKENIHIDTCVAEGMLTRERLSQITNIEEIFKLPTKNGASHIYIVGDTVFIVIFRENIIAVQISHSDIAQTLHFLFDQLQEK